MIAVFGGMHALRRGAQDDADLALVTDAQRSTWSWRYFGLCAFLGACIAFTHELVGSHS
jgi:hypothetical protein